MGIVPGYDDPCQSLTYLALVCARRRYAVAEILDAPDVELSEIVAQLEVLRRMLVHEADLTLAPASLVNLAAQVVPHSVGAAVTVVEAGRVPRTIAATGQLPLDVDAIQYETGEGPCLEASTESDIVRGDDLRRDSQWPKFAARAVAETPVRSMFAVRIQHEADRRSALNFYGVAPNVFDDVDRGTGAMFASFVSLAFAGAAARREAELLRAGLESNRQIGVAIGILMARKLYTQDQAFGHLRASSQQLNVKLRDIAAEVARTGQLPGAVQ